MQKEKESLLTQLAKKEEILLLEIKEKEDIIASSESKSTHKMGVITSLNLIIDEEKQKNTDFKQEIVNLKQEIVDLKQENANLSAAKKELLAKKDQLEFSIAEVEMRAQMELMMEYKAGKHVDWDPDAVIKEYHTTFPSTPALEDAPSSQLES